jgi:hypothetical protein
VIHGGEAVEEQDTVVPLMPKASSR